MQVGLAGTRLGVTSDPVAQRSASAGPFHFSLLFTSFPRHTKPASAWEILLESRADRTPLISGFAQDFQETCW